MSILQLLAQTTQAPPVAKPWYVIDPQSLLIFVGIAVAAMFLFGSGKSRRVEEKNRQEMLKNLKRGDRVQTIGGVFGTVVDARPGDVVLKVDESSNTKIKFARESIKRVVTDEDTTAK